MVLTNLIGTANIQLMNLRRHKPVEPYDFRIDRPSPLGNKFPMLSEANRLTCIDLFKTYLKHEIERNPFGPVAKEIDTMVKAHEEHGILRIFCWCKPKRCHGEPIIEVIKERFYQ